MGAPSAAPAARVLTFKEGWLWTMLAVASFQVACSFSACAFVFAFHLFCILQLSRVRTNRGAMRLGMGIGPLIYGPKLLFFWTVFGPTAIALWLVLAFWLGLFLVMMRSCRERFGERWAAVAAPILWTGLEYFRSELYYLRFSWLNAGYAFAWSPILPVVKFLGMYGLGFVLMTLASIASGLTARGRRGEEAGLLDRQESPLILEAGAPVSDAARNRPPAQARRVGGRRSERHGSIAGVAGALALFAMLGIVTNLPALRAPSSAPGAEERGDRRILKRPLRIAGIQMEFPGELEVIQSLNKLHRAYPQAQLLVLSEYSFSDGPVPDRVRAWCRTNQIYLAAGAKDELPDGRYYNTIFVIGPKGDIVFQQAKKQPIQFFKDGQPAPVQRLWHSPWGRLGICICYDLSYTRIVDELVRQGAQALIVPTMDVADWGEAQHRLHSRVAPVRAAEHGLQIFRLASSGISQWVDERGVVRASAPFPGEESMLAAELQLVDNASRPLDRFLAPTATALTVLLAAWIAALAVRKTLKNRA
ncbi:MAG: apolipoprotein N-acyltransferase [Verrucomicrobiota bacterium]|jgi:apolipoprotein N-acyltransferase